MISPDIAMPAALLAIVTAAMLLNERVENKLKTTFEHRELHTRDIILFVLTIAIAISVIAYVSLLKPGQIFHNIILTFFLLSYSILLFTFTNTFSKMQKRKAQLFSFVFGVFSLIIAATNFLEPLKDSYAFYRVIAFFALTTFSFCTILIVQKKQDERERWYISVQPPALFLLLFIFYNLLYTGEAQIWDPILMNIYAIVVAVMIIFYLSPLFTWKTTVIFAALLTIVDIILVLGTRTMGEAANQFTEIGLPVVVFLPNIPLTPVPPSYPYKSFYGFYGNGLGVGDFFFAGILAIQTLKKFDKKTALISVFAMTISFALFLALMGEIIKVLEPLIGPGIEYFPGTLMIICGWLPVVIWKTITAKRSA